MEEDVKSIGDYISIAWRRKFQIIIPFIIVLAIAVVTVFQIPRVYQSTGTILVESQQIPTELVQSTVTSFAGERIQVLTQRIMSRQQLLEIVEKFDLYKDQSDQVSRSEILDDMRSRIVIETVGANLRGRARTAISFTVSYEHISPILAQKVVNELITLFLDENIKSRTERAVETTEFLQKEGDRLRSKIEVMEEQIASYKQENKGRLPENLRISLERIEELKTLLFNTEREMNDLNENKKLLAIELISAESNSANTVLDGNQPSPEIELRNMQNQFVSLSARYGAEHPDVKAIKRKIKAFEKEYGPLGDGSELREEVELVQSEIYELTQKYSSEHPDVKRLKRKLSGLEAVLSEYNVNPKTNVNQTNPEYLQAKARLESIESNIISLKKTRLNLEQQIALLDTRINQTPQVERGLDALERDYDNTKRKYQEIRNKQSQAELAMNLEEDQKGERFTLIEPPLLPHRPIKPNRPKMLLMGFILAVMSGIGVAGVAETIDGGIRGERALTRITKMRPLVTIPYIRTQQDETIRKRNLKLSVLALLMLGIVFVTSVHHFYKPLDLLWFILLRKLNLS